MTESGSKILHVSRLNHAADALYARSLSFKRKIFREFRIRIGNLKSVACFTLQQAVRDKLRLLLKIFQAWKKEVNMTNKCRKVSNMMSKKYLLSLTFKKWKQENEVVKKSNKIVLHYLRLRAIKWIKLLRYLTRRKKKKILQKQRKRATALCVLVKRIFLAWKCHTEHSLLTPKKEAQGMFRAVQFIKERIFHAWSSLTSKNIARNEGLSSDVRNASTVRNLKTYFTQWHLITKSLNYSYYSSYKRGLNSFFNYAMKCQKEKEMMGSAVQQYSASVTLQAIRLLKIHAMKRKRARTAALVVASRANKRCSIKSWTGWCKAYRRHLKECSPRTFLTLDSKNIGNKTAQAAIDIHHTHDHDFPLSPSSSSTTNSYYSSSSSPSIRYLQNYEAKQQQYEQQQQQQQQEEKQQYQMEIMWGRRQRQVAVHDVDTVPNRQSVKSLRSIAQRGGDVSNDTHTDSCRNTDTVKYRDRDESGVWDRERNRDRDRDRYRDRYRDRERDKTASWNDSYLSDGGGVRETEEDDDDDEGEDRDTTYGTISKHSKLYRLCLIRAMRRWHCTALKRKHVRISAHRLMITSRSRCVRAGFTTMTSLWIKAVRMKMKEMAVAVDVLDVPYNLPQDQLYHPSSFEKLKAGDSGDVEEGEVGGGGGGGVEGVALSSLERGGVGSM